MAWFDQLPNEILLKIFSYLSIDDLVLCVRNVCTRWRTVSDDDEIWMPLRYSPHGSVPQEDIIRNLQNMPALRTFRYTGICNIIENLSEYCRRIRVLKIPHIKLKASLLKLTMERLTELRVLDILISPTEGGPELTRIIGQSKTLVRLHLTSADGDTLTEGLLKPIADGCPNLKKLKCEDFNCPSSEICYLLQRKKHQLVTYDHRGLVSADFFTALNECTNLKRLTFIDVHIDGPFEEIPPITKLQNLEALEISCCRFPMVKKIPLTLFLETFPFLSYIGIPYAEGNIDDLTNKILLKCPSLEYLNLEGNYELHCRGLRNIGSCKLLKYLDVSSCTELRKKAMKYVAEGCPELQYLDVSGIDISDGMFRQILRCSKLKTLLMEDCDLSAINLNLNLTNVTALLHSHIGPGFELLTDVMKKIEEGMSCMVIQDASRDASKYSRLEAHPIRMCPE
jgi:Leucine-rich repeat (LRR) protein